MRRKQKIAILIISIIFIFAILGIIVHKNIYYKASEEAKVILKESNVITKDNYIEMKANDNSMGLIFYPGGGVECEAYLPILKLLNKNNINIFLINMPLDMAVFNENAADKVIDENEDIETWYLAGHSLGGTMVSTYAQKNQNKIESIFLLGSYSYSDYPLDKTLTIYGENDLLVRDDIKYENNVVEIEGGNHAQFGNYGIQARDGEATITREEQQKLAVDEMLIFIKDK